ncbi:MAG TPA: SRPBCC domain-containing protein, partial [Acidimicrobiia bacterium]
SVWEPGKRLVFTWLSPQPADDDSPTEVEVRFEDLEGRTRIVLEHRGIAGMEVGNTTSSVVGLWWSDLLVGFRSSVT